MACNPTRIELSNSAATTMIVTLATDPGDGSTVSFEVDGLGIDDSATTSSGVATFTIDAQTGQTNFSLWDATLQVESNAPADAVVMIVETNEAQNIGVQLDDTDVSYCAPLDAGGTGQASSLNGPVLFTAKNETGGTITKGQVLFISGAAAAGDVPTVGLADADNSAAMPAFGMAFANANNNAEVTVVTFGTITGLDTSSYSEGDTVYVSTTAGDLTATPPAGESSLIQNMGVVVRSHASAGTIKIIGAGRANDTPNLDDGDIFIGNASNQTTTAALSGLVGVTSVTAGSGLTGGTITSSGTIAHQAQPASGTGPAFVKSVEIDSFGHVTNVVGEATAAAYRTETGTDDASNLTTGTIAAARLPAISDSYTGQIETADDKTYTIDPGVVTARTITSFYARSGSGTCTATLKNDTATVGVVSVTTSSTTAIISNASVAADDPITLVISSNSSATDVVFSVEFTQ